MLNKKLVISYLINLYFQFALYLNMQYWMPNAKLFIRPAPLGLEMLLVGNEINWKTFAQLTREEVKNEAPEENDSLPELIPL